MEEPEYYCKNGLSPLKSFEQGLLSREEYIGFCKGNIIKYTVRAGDKDNPLLDIDKAIDYLHYLRDVYKNESEEKLDSQIKNEVKNSGICSLNKNQQLTKDQNLRGLLDKLEEKFSLTGYDGDRYDNSYDFIDEEYKNHWWGKFREEMNEK